MRVPPTPGVLIRAAAILAAAFALPASAQQTDSIEVVEVEFRGRLQLAESALEDVIVTHATSCRSALAAPLCFIGVDAVRNERYLDSAEVARDAERIAVAYEIHGYPGTVVTHRIEREGAAGRVVFLIDEAPPFVIDAIQVVGLPAGVEPPDALPLAVGDAYSLPALDASIERIRFHLARHGYAYASVAVDGSVDEPARSAVLRLVVDPGPLVRFGDVRIRADAPLSDAPIRDRLALEPGMPYDPLALERTERRLYQLEATGRAIARVEGLRDSATVLPVAVDVTAGPLRGLESEATLSTTDCVEAAAFWTHRHLLGRPRVLRVGAAVSNVLAEPLDGSFPCHDAGTDAYGVVGYRGQVSLDEPIAGTAGTWLRAQLFAERHSTPDVFVERAAGAQLTLSHQPSDDLGVALEYAPRRFELDAASLYLCGNYGACELEARDALAGPAWLAPLTASVAWMSDGELQGVTRDKLSLWRLEPLPRFRAEVRAAAEAAGGWSVSDYAYQRVLAQASATRRWGETLELAARVRGGVLFGDDLLPPAVRLYAGGPMSVRGTQQNLFGPATLVADPGDAAAIPCAAAASGCSGEPVDPDLVRLRPLGADRLVEAALETRWSFASRAQAAAFVDFGWIARDDAFDDDWIVSPGVGLRLIANIGAIRIDLAFDPRGARDLPLRSAPDADGAIADLGFVRYDPFGYDDPGFLRGALRRMQLHFAIGQAF